jgi:hypothetical protein
MTRQCSQINQASTIITYGNIVVIVFYMVGGFCTAPGMVGLIQAARINKSHT